MSEAQPMAEKVLDDIWANEGGVSLRVVVTEKHELRVELTQGVAEPATTAVTLTGYRAYRLGQVLVKEWRKP